MIYGIKYGLRDIKKYKYFFISSIFMLVIMNLVITLALHTGAFNLEEQPLNENIKSIEVVYTSYDLSYDIDIVNNLVGLYQRDAVGLLYSDSLSDGYNKPVYLVLGDISLLDTSISGSGSITVFETGSKDYQTIELMGVDYDVVHGINEGQYFQEDALYISYREEALEGVLNDIASDNQLVLYEVIESSLVSRSNSTAFTSGLNALLPGISAKVFSDRYALEFSGSMFLFGYLIPLIGLFLMAVSFAFILVFNGMFRRMNRELTIHLSHGANIVDLVIRFMVFYLVLFVVSLVVNNFTGTISRDFYGFYLLFYVVLLGVIGCYITVKLKRENLLDNIRGEKL